MCLRKSYYTQPSILTIIGLLGRSRGPAHQVCRDNMWICVVYAYMCVHAVSACKHTHTHTHTHTYTHIHTHVYIDMYACSFSFIKGYGSCSFSHRKQITLHTGHKKKGGKDLECGNAFSFNVYYWFQIPKYFFPFLTQSSLLSLKCVILQEYYVDKIWVWFII